MLAPAAAATEGAQLRPFRIMQFVKSWFVCPPEFVLRPRAE